MNRTIKLFNWRVNLSVYREPTEQEKQYFNLLLSPASHQAYCLTLMEVWNTENPGVQPTNEDLHAIHMSRLN